MTNRKIAFIGGGNMTRAIAGGMVEGGFEAAELLISEPNADARKTLTSSLPGATISASNKHIATGADCIVLAVKPQVLAEVCRDLSETIQLSKPLIISIAAGVRSRDIDNWLGGGLSVVRIMPNQPALLRLGVSGLYANDRTSKMERERAADIISAVGAVVDVNSEADIDAVTAVSGSGPAYFFLLIDVLAKTAVEFGIDAVAARTLAIETATGAAALAAHGDAAIDDLIARVRSPGGTTAAALDSLEAANVRAIFAEAIFAARDRAVVLADAAHNNQT
ncbi:MAG: pyrroline-5-carboxylate reductase [Gammaproteobacteria bacterium]|nr:pyrroline-5-carboxylate reductase [Gammaproteobacteria bacterium]